jgi:hypothetical protein
MILIVGTLNDRVIRRLCACLLWRGLPFHLLNPNNMPDEVVIDIATAHGRMVGRIVVGCDAISINGISAVFARPPDTSVEFPVQDATRRHALDAQVNQLLERLPCIVVNRPSSQTSNGAKPFQYRYLRAVGFRVPETCITSSADTAREFVLSQTSGVIFKSVSAVRSKVTVLGETDAALIGRRGCGPVQLQALIAGLDIRVHVVGSDVFATSIESDSIDYRYPRKGDLPVKQEVGIPTGVMDACRRLAAKLRLSLAGIDLRVTPNGEWYCFEVNPSPYYSFYEESHSQRITQAVARLVASHVLPSWDTWKKPNCLERTRSLGDGQAELVLESRVFERSSEEPFIGSELRPTPGQGSGIVPERFWDAPALAEELVEDTAVFSSSCSSRGVGVDVRRYFQGN